MRGRYINATIAILVALAAISTSGVSAASAQVAIRGAYFRAVRQAPALDFACPDKTVCAFPNDDYTGNYPAWGVPQNSPQTCTMGGGSPSPSRKLATPIQVPLTITPPRLCGYMKKMSHSARLIRSVFL